MASSDSQTDKPRGHPKGAELPDVNINTGAQNIRLRELRLHELVSFTLANLLTVTVNVDGDEFEGGKSSSHCIVVHKINKYHIETKSTCLHNCHEPLPYE